MARWKRGESEVGSARYRRAAEAHRRRRNGERLLENATVRLTTARSAVETDPDSAFVLAYDASRQAGHPRPVRPRVRQFGALRRRRNELEYPERAGDDATQDDATEAVENAEAILAAAQGPLDQLGLF